jgi:periplasmic divalent cation tolerance protein
MEQARIVLTTVSSKEEAERMARSLVESRLAACVNVMGGVHSTYRWQGAVESAEEVMLDQDQCGKARRAGSGGAWHALV